MVTPVKVNLQIPRNISEQGLEYLGYLARTVPAGGIIVEVGALFGSSTWVLSKNAAPSVKIISIDPWSSASAKKEIEAKYPDSPPLTRENFLRNVADCPNVEAVQGVGPEVIKKQKGPIALFFYNRPTRTIELATHLKTLNGMLGPGGIAAGNDFTPSSVDVISSVSILADQWRKKPEVIGRVWAMTKPGAGTEGQTVYERAGPYTDYDLSVWIKLKSGKVIEHTPGSWAGSLDEWSPIKGMKVDWATPRTDGLTGAYQVIGSGSKTSNWAAFGEWAELGGPIGGIRAHLIGGGSADVRLTYQVNYLMEQRGRRVITRSSKVFRDGVWVVNDAPVKPAGISALRCFVQGPGETPASPSAESGPANSYAAE
jgi:hypothetical protein